MAREASAGRRLFANSALIVASRVLTATLSLLAVPIVIRRLGIEGFGAWEALLACASIGWILQGSISGTLVWRTSIAFGAGNFEEIRRLVRVGAGITILLGGLVSTLALFFRAEIVSLLHIPVLFRTEALQVFPVLATFVLLGGLGDVLESVANGCQRSGWVPVVGAVALALNYLIAVTGLLLGYGLWPLALGQGAGLVARATIGFFIARRLTGSISLLPTLPLRSDLTSARYSGLMMIGFLSSALRDQTDKLVLSTFASASWVGYYSIASKLANLVMEVVRFFYMPMLTAVGALYAVDDWEGVRRLYSRMMAVVSTVAGIVVVVVAGMSGPLIVMWMGHPIPEVTPLLLLLLSGTAAAVMLTGPGTALCRGIGRVEIETAYVSMNLVLNLALTILLVLAIGPFGTVVASGTTWAVSAALFALLLHNRLPLPVEATRRAGFAALLAASLAVGLNAIMSRGQQPDGRVAALLVLLTYGLPAAASYVISGIALRLFPVADIVDLLKVLHLKKRT
ncbi:MAG: lipopolysaccharide biosynthesis protein [Gemmatimonadaceae bacterium]